MSTQRKLLQAYFQAEEETQVLPVISSQGSCHKLEFTESEHYQAVCIKANGDIDVTCANRDYIQTGSKVGIRCNPPYQNKRRPTYLTCHDGNWLGELEKVECVFQSNLHSGENYNIYQTETQKNKPANFYITGEKYDTTNSNTNGIQSPFDKVSTALSPSHTGNSTLGTNDAQSQSLCRQLNFKENNSFQFLCISPSGEIDYDCSSKKYVVSGTKAFFRCKPPYKTQEPIRYFQCKNHEWVGEFKQVVCLSSEESGLYHDRVEHTLVPVTTTEAPFSYFYQEEKPGKNPIKEPINFPVAVYQTTSTTPRPTVKTTTFRPAQKVTTLRPPQKVTTPIPTLAPAKQQQFCPPLHHRSTGVRLECVGKSGFADAASLNTCDSPQSWGTEARYSCLPYFTATGTLSTLYRTCGENGQWTGSSYGFACVIECGRANSIKTAFITNGEPTERAQWPWHTAIFSKEDSDWQYICGGTLISTRAVVRTIFNF